MVVSLTRKLRTLIKIAMINVNRRVSVAHDHGELASNFDELVRNKNAFCNRVLSASVESADSR